MFKITHHDTNGLAYGSKLEFAASEENAIEQGKFLAQSLGWIDYTIADNNDKILYFSDRAAMKKHLLLFYNSAMYIAKSVAEQGQKLPKKDKDFIRCAVEALCRVGVL